MNNRNRKLFTYAINFTILIFGMQMTMIGPLIEKMSQSFHLSVAQMGSFFTVSAAGFTVAIIFGGIISDRIGKKRVVIWSGFGFASALLLFSLSPSLLFSIILFFLAGGFGGVIEGTLSAMVADINPGNERRAVTFAHVFFGVGAIIGPALAGWLANTDFSWQSAYMVASLLAFIAVIWVIRFEYPAVKAEEKLEMKAFKSILSNRGFLLLCTAVALYVGVETTVWGWTPKYLSLDLGLNETFAGVMVSLLWAGITIGRFISAMLAEKLSNKVLVCGLCIISILGLLAQLSSALQPFAPVTFFLLGIGFSGIWPLIVSEAGTLFKSKYTGTAFGLAFAAGGIGGMTVPYIFGFVAEHVQMSILFATLTIPLIFIMIISFILDKAEEVEESAA
ncbi:MFS transporter [Lederbergia citrea]|uniref:MFS transporter n=1 Tax=Lederbergia citrea TaxID=2833581 RepID=UPI001BC96917|nr:MFS transporter [Lederbergia citrea]MBS4178217.1 MFS transporter [Lederbergia citrea]